MKTPTSKQSIEERVARVIARKLGHNDDEGMYWERYLSAAQGIVAEFKVQPKLLEVA